ncbi:MAG: GAF domain-containing protein [Synechococcaceae cyanobacterium SM2_3_1]|nr:GAF domain-containing protein [Synechococcaceae cyanobacterium SM2_3_1]
MVLQNVFPWFRQDRHVLEVLADLSHRNGDINLYLQAIAVGVSQLIRVRWTIITLCLDQEEKLLASNLPLEDPDRSYQLHGTLTQTVVETGRTLVVSDTERCTLYGKPPAGYRAYLGVPLRCPFDTVKGTICSFHDHPRRFTQEEVRIVELFAERAAVAIDNLQLYQAQQEFNTTLQDTVERVKSELHQTQAQLLERERLAAIGKFAAMIVHEIRNPLATIQLTFDHFHHRLSLPTDSQERLELARSELVRLEMLASEILAYARPPLNNPQDLELNQFSRQLLADLQDMGIASDRKIHFIPWPDPLWVEAEANRLKQVFINLIRNACEAIQPGDMVEWEIRPISLIFKL